ncbi:MAG: DEAD/DEAH box helicase, partial [Elusimicrobia bacterium]|nr:DEAD/DEAH box helicase [Elusimicrobiota bacterium]
MMICGLANTSAKAYFAAQRFSGKNFIFICSSDELAQDFYDCFSAMPSILGGEMRAIYFGDNAIIQSAALFNLAQNSGRSPLAVIADSQGLAAKIMPPKIFQANTLTLSTGDTIGRQDVISALVKNGYERVDFAEQPGEFAVRGSVLDIFCVEPQQPARLFFSASRIESVRVFDIETQQTKSFVDSVCLFPITCKGESSLFDWLDKSFSLVIDGAARKEASKIKGFERGGFKTIISCLNRGELERIEELLAEHSCGRSSVFVISGLGRGFYRPSEKLAVITSADILNRAYHRSSLIKNFEKSSSARIRFKDFKPGDFAVHESYGIGKYLGLKAVCAGENLLVDCLTLEYRHGHRLFVPMYDFKRVQKYVGAEGKSPRLASLDGRSWADVKARVRKNTEHIARELLKLEARRLAAKASALPGDEHIEREFADSFPYEETGDQLKTINNTLDGLLSEHPVDRIVAGDVGFGKTEVAMRAALRCALSGRQTAILVPTTVLAAQHYRTFCQRMAGFPVNISLLCRFQSKAEQKKAATAVKCGQCDIVIGTHRLLSKDISFARLGLCIIDEEHRFGVKQKEKIKAFSSSAHTIMMTATPIPRTFYQAVSGLREISVIETPPSGRMPIATKIIPWDEKISASAVREEISRGGQVYYVYNRVKTLGQRLNFLKKLLPEVKIKMAHGQMRERELEMAMWDFYNKKYDVLLSSTIIESGLDIPNVNTIIIENAHEFGLSQLYQLRGRIGRSDRKAHCYLFYPAGVDTT